MERDFFESSEFYSKRYKNFSTIIIIPISLIVFFSVLFSIFCKKDIAIQGTGTIETLAPVKVIQSQLNYPIIKNNLKEGVKVSKGDILLVYKDENRNAENSISQKINALHQQLSDINTLKSGIINNTDTFNYDDEFGYHNDLKAYLKQRDIYDLERDMLQHNNSDQNKVSEKDNLSINQDKLLIMQEEKISELNKKEFQLKQNILDLELDLKNSKPSKLKVVAPISGTIHVNQEYKDMDIIEKGSTVAEIYPDINNSKIKLISYVPARDISSIKKGQILKFNVRENTPKIFSLEGRITNISISPTKNKSGDFYEVSADSKIPSNQISNIKYGMSGSTSIITGKITFFEYYKNKLLNIGNN